MQKKYSNFIKDYFLINRTLKDMLIFGCTKYVQCDDTYNA
jgi:hypothetical protein